MNTIGAIIRTAREQAQITPDTLAATIGIDTEELTHIETGGRPLDVDELFDIATALGTTTRELLCPTD